MVTPEDRSDGGAARLVEWRVELMMAEINAYRVEIRDTVRIVDRVLALVVPIVIGLTTIAFVEELPWVAIAAPFAHALISFYTLDAYVEMGYMGGVRRAIEENLSEMLGDGPDWRSPLVWETRVAPDRWYAAPRLAVGVLWVLSYGVACGVAIWSVRSTGWQVAGLLLAFAALVPIYALSFLWMAKAPSRGYGFATGAHPGEIPVPLKRLRRIWPRSPRSVTTVTSVSSEADKADAAPHS